MSACQYCEIRERLGHKHRRRRVIADYKSSMAAGWRFSCFAEERRDRVTTRKVGPSEHPEICQGAKYRHANYHTTPPRDQPYCVTSGFRAQYMELNEAHEPSGNSRDFVVHREPGLDIRNSRDAWPIPHHRRIVPLDAVNQPVGQLDWIGGFSSRGCNELEAYMTPAVRCIARTPATRDLYSTAIARTKDASVVRTFRLKSIADVTLGGIHFLAKSPFPISIPEETAVHDDRSSWEARCLLHINDEESLCLPFSELSRRKPDIAAMIASWNPCPPSVSFFVTESQGLTAIIPTTAILQACYMPAKLADHLTNTHPRDHFADGRQVAFNGFSFGRLKSAHYPKRCTENFLRAEREISQILPRAVAYFKSHGDCLPLLLRPPFLGKAIVSGRCAFLREKNLSYILFTSAVRFEPGPGELPRYARNRKSRDEILLDARCLRIVPNT